MGWIYTNDKAIRKLAPLMMIPSPNPNHNCNPNYEMLTLERFNFRVENKSVVRLFTVICYELHQLSQVSGRKEMFYLTMFTTRFIYHFMLIWIQTYGKNYSEE